MHTLIFFNHLQGRWNHYRPRLAKPLRCFTLQWLVHAQKVRLAD